MSDIPKLYAISHRYFENRVQEGEIYMQKEERQTK